MTYIQPNPNGSATSANSAPVVVASDQAAITVKQATAASLNVTEANSSTINTSLGTINTSIGTTNTDLTGGTQKSQVVDGSGNVIGSVSNALKVNTTNGALETGGNLATTATNTTNLTPAQGSTTSGQVGPLAQTATTTSAPTYTTAKTNPLSTDTSGNLRTSVNNTVTVSGTVTTTPPSNASTNLAQVGGSSISLGTAAAGSSIPVALPTATITSLQQPTLQSGSTTAVTQATASNLNATVVGTGTFAVQNTNQVSTTGGATPYSFISASGTNATNVKASAGTVYSMVAMNTSASARYIHMYNSASAPTAGSGTPIKRFLVPIGGGFTWPIPPQGVAFSSGIGFTITGGVTDADTTSISASDVVLNLDYA
jgi:hypothetical protein